MKRIIACVLAICVPTSVVAHHSFAAFFDDTDIVKVTGKVISFGFRNPHGTIALNVEAKNGTTSVWRVETNAPVVLQRRGWTRNSLKAGDTITIIGWRARNGKPYIRLQQALDSTGKPIGDVPFGKSDG